MQYMSLQNGSDVRGIAMEGVPGETTNLTARAAADITGAFVRLHALKIDKPIEQLKLAVGRDSRLTGEALAAGVILGADAMGAAAYDCGMASTPAMFMSTVLPELGFDIAIMVTASHLPFNRNGLKFFTPCGGLEKEEIFELLRESVPGYWPEQPSRRLKADIMTAYCTHLRRVIIEGVDDKVQPDKPLRGLKLAVDAGNGAGGFFAKQILEPLGADVSASIFLEPDGMFPNHVPNPENPKAMAAIAKATVEGGCDMGFIFDTDVDRASAVDENGNELCRNKLIALVAAIVAEQAPGSTIVTDSVTSKQLTDFIQNVLHCKHYRYKRGYKNVINEAIRLNKEGEQTLLAIETSGHAALKENYFMDDGAYLCAKIVIKLVQQRRKGFGIGSLVARLKEPLETCELRGNIVDCDNFLDYGQRVLWGLKMLVKEQKGWELDPDNREGIRVNIDEWDGWFLLRISLHDPQMPLNIESDKPGGVQAIRNSLLHLISGYDKLVWPQP